MIQISKLQQQEMINLGILKQSNKNWTITSVHKKSRRKKRYVDELKFKKYLAVKNGEEIDLKDDDNFLNY